MSKESRRPAPVLGAILLLALAIRLWGLTVQSLWYDEGFSVHLAGQSWGKILFGELNLPPLYHLLLGLWIRLAGYGEFAVRYLSVWWGLLIVALGGLLATRLVGRRAGAFTALLLAVSPIEVWYAQETRMYAMLGALTLVSSCLLARLLASPLADWRGDKGGDRRRWLLYALANIAAIYTHYYAALVLAAQAVWVLLYLCRSRDPKVARAWLLAQAALVVALLPWLPVLWGQWRAANTTYWPGRLNLQFVARNTALGFAGAGLTVSNEVALRLAIAILALAALGSLVGLARPSQRWGTLALVLLVIVPFAIFYLLVRDRPKFSPRYLLPIVPPLLALAAQPLAALWPQGRRWHEWGRMGLALLLAAGVALSSARVATAAVRDTSVGRDDLRGAAAYLSEAVGGNEAVVLLSGHLEPAFTYYYHRSNCYPIPPHYTPSPSVDDVLTPAILADLNRILEGRQGVWFVLWQDDVVDPNGLVLTAFDLVATQVPVPAGFRGLRLRHYVFPAGTRLPEDIFRRNPLNAAIGGGEILLRGCTLPSAPVPAGGEATFTLLWDATAAIHDEYGLSLRVFDEQGEQRGGADSRLAGFMYPTTRWRPGLVVGSHRVRLPIDLPPGDYEVRAVVYRQSDGANWTVPLGRFQVGRALHQPAPGELDIQHPLNLSLGEFELLGYGLFPEQATLGQTVHLTVFLRARERPRSRSQLSLWLAGQLWQRFALPESTAAMEPGDVFALQYPLTVPREAPAGQQPLAMALGTADGQPTGSPQVLGRLDVAATQHLFDVPASIQSPQHFTLGDGVRFLGYDLQGGSLRAGEALHLTLYWQCLRPMDTSYTVFTHVLDSQSKVWGQVDRIPLGEARPTTGWLPGEVFVDSYEIPVRADAPPGTYAVEVGMYDAATGVRLAVRDEQGRAMADDRVLLTTLELGR